MAPNTALRRHRAMQRVHRMYKRNDAGLGGVCVYCGARADSLDHVPPVSVAADLDLDHLKSMGPALLPACRHCNSILGDSHQIMLVDRRDIVATYISTKRKHMLARGQKLHETRVRLHADFRDIACLQIFHRWLFATLTVSEVDHEKEEEEEVYVREDFSKKLDAGEVPFALWLINWGLSEDKVDAIEEAFDRGMPAPTGSLSEVEKARLAAALRYQPLRGPFGWPGTAQSYRKSVTADLSAEDHEDLTKRMVAMRAPFSLSNFDTVPSPLPSLLATQAERPALKSASKMLRETSPSPSAPRHSSAVLTLDALSQLPVSQWKNDYLNYRVRNFPALGPTETAIIVRDILGSLSNEGVGGLTRARKHSLPFFEIYLSHDTKALLRRDDGGTFFLAILFSVNTSPEQRRQLVQAYLAAAD